MIHHSANNENGKKSSKIPARNAHNLQEVSIIYHLEKMISTLTSTDLVLAINKVRNHQ